MSRILPNVAYESSGFPRVSGDEPYLAMAAVLESAFSPRERG